MNTPRALKTKIKSPDSLARILKSERRKGRKIVFTNGCFDIIHKGHVEYLLRARKLGDILVVGMDTDSSVRKLKGPERPINPLKDRMDVMAALESIDYVTWFADGNPLPLILKVHPDILVKGGDWKPEQIIGSREVLSWGGKVRSLKFVEGRSTTRIIEKARKRA